jgi:hypothetical protein
MLAKPIDKAVPAESLFPNWRGREPWHERVHLARSALRAANPPLDEAIASLPFEIFEAAAYCQHEPVFKYNDVPAEAEALFARLPDAIRAPWLCALLLWHMDRFDAVFAAHGLDAEFALHYGDAFHRLIDQIGKDMSFADLGKDSFLKDLWLARVVMIPAFAQVWWPHSGLAARDVLRGGPGAALHVFGRCGGRRPFLEGHTHDPVARAYWNEAGWGEALRLAALALPALPQARGVFGTAWFYDPAVKQVSPRIAFAQDLQVGRGGYRLRIGSNEAAIANALATSAERRNRYKDGSYLPTDYAIVWSRRDLISAYGA